MSTTDDPMRQSKDSSKPSTNDQYVISEIQLGIWKVFTATQKRTLGLWQEIWEAYPFIIRSILDVHEACPRLLYFQLLSVCWNGVRMALEIQVESILLRQIELAVSTGKGNTFAAAFAIGCRILHSLICSYIEWADGAVIPSLQSRVKQHFHIRFMNAKLLKDLPTSAETPEREVREDEVLESFQIIFRVWRIFLEISSQVLVLLEISRMNGANILLAAILLQLILLRLSPLPVWTLTFFAYINNDAYKRVQSLNEFADGSFRQDIISSNLVNWITTEYRKATAAIGDTSTDDLYYQLKYDRSSSLLSATQELLTAFPSVYFATIATIYPQYLSIATIATLQVSGQNLTRSVGTLAFEFDTIRKGLHTVKRIYAPTISSIMKDGASPLAEEEGDTAKGMSLILNDVSFAYPGGGKKGNVLKGINLHIKAGQLVIVVGANGSGKSTLTRILARLYDHSSGEFLIEGRPSTGYRVKDLHLATSLLSQDSKLYPLSLAENIGLGYPERFSDLEMIKEAASDGGAAGFIEELENGYETILETFDSSFHMNLQDREHPLRIMSDEMTNHLDISGGQRQRVIAARTFMRFKSGKVRLVLVDEPTSALDAEGELQLFQRLMSAREGKTMVFVTHRFGHLTKFADQIICMKDGTIVESGSHAELMSLAGEYANLYKIQARAFSEESTDGKC